MRRVGGYSAADNYAGPGGVPFGGSAMWQVADNPTGPLTQSGRPDMRFSANRGGRR